MRRTFLAVAGLLGAVPAFAQQADPMPGVKLTIDQLKAQMFHVSAGRRLKPASWPGGATDTAAAAGRSWRATDSRSCPGYGTDAPSEAPSPSRSRTRSGRRSTAT